MSLDFSFITPKGKEKVYKMNPFQLFSEVWECCSFDSKITLEYASDLSHTYDELLVFFNSALIN